jgi:hypothetical protein
MKSSIVQFFNQFAYHPDKLDIKHLEFFTFKEKVALLEKDSLDKIHARGGTVFILINFIASFLISLFFTDAMLSLIIGCSMTFIAFIVAIIIDETDSSQIMYQWLFPSFRKYRKIKLFLNKHYLQLLDNREYQYELLAQIDEYVNSIAHRDEWIIKKYRQRVSENQAIIKSRFIEASIHPEHKVKYYNLVQDSVQEILKSIVKIQSVDKEAVIRQDYEKNQQVFMQQTRQIDNASEQGIDGAIAIHMAKNHRQDSGTEQEKEKMVQLDIQSML